MKLEYDDDDEDKYEYKGAAHERLAFAFKRVYMVGLRHGRML